MQPAEDNIVDEPMPQLPMPQAEIVVVSMPQAEIVDPPMPQVQPEIIEDNRIMRIVHCTYMYKGVRKPRTKKVYRKYPNRGRPIGKWQPTQEQIDLVKKHIAEGTKIGDLRGACNLKQYQIDTIRQRI